ncbi:MAG: hypothetical protein HKO03_01780 [Acidimicrobiia bacterium]|nr:hypothetical protein [Acidimicrobiia bacterium]
MTDKELVATISQIAADTGSRFKGEGWSLDEQELLFRELRRTNLGVTEDILWRAYNHACERGGTFTPPVNTFIADIRYQIRRQVTDRPVLTSGVPTPDDESYGANELKKYLERIGVSSFVEAMEYEYEKRTGEKMPA